jgi:cytochrome oxidase Cu insertion factor (SCO1/SenC/PrrC family)
MIGDEEFCSSCATGRTYIGVLLMTGPKYDAPQAGAIIISIHSKRDVPAVTLLYSKALGLNDVWHFVGGFVKAVQAVWASYPIGVTADPDTDAVASPKEEKGAMDMDKQPPQRLSSDDLTFVGQIVQQ